VISLTFASSLTLTSNPARKLSLHTEYFFQRVLVLPYLEMSEKSKGRGSSHAKVKSSTGPNSSRSSLAKNSMDHHSQDEEPLVDPSVASLTHTALEPKKVRLSSFSFSFLHLGPLSFPITFSMFINRFLHFLFHTGA